MAAGFEEIDHSGDVGIEAFGENLCELFEQLTRGLFGLLCRSAVQPRRRRHLIVRANSVEELVVDWLNEVIACGAIQGEMYGAVDVTTAEAGVVAGTVAGESIDTTRHDLRFDVKAATYHGIQVTTTPPSCRGRVIFDL